MWFVPILVGGVVVWVLTQLPRWLNPQAMPAPPPMMPPPMMPLPPMGPPMQPTMQPPMGPPMPDPASAPPRTVPQPPPTAGGIPALPPGMDAVYPRANQRISVLVERPGAHLAPNWVSAALVKQQIFEALAARGYRAFVDDDPLVTTIPVGVSNVPGVPPPPMVKQIIPRPGGFAHGGTVDAIYVRLLVVDVGPGAGLPRNLGPGLRVFGA